MRQENSLNRRWHGERHVVLRLRICASGRSYFAQDDKNVGARGLLLIDVRGGGGQRRLGHEEIVVVKIVVEVAGDLGAWNPMTADEQLGYVYIPLTAPTAWMASMTAMPQTMATCQSPTWAFVRTAA